MVNLSAQHVYLNLLWPRALFSSRLNPCKNSLLSQWTSGCSLNQSTLSTHPVYRGRQVSPAKSPGGPGSPIFPGGPWLPLLPLDPLFPLVPWGPCEPRFPVSPLAPLLPGLPGKQNTGGIVVFDEDGVTQFPGIPGGPCKPEGPRGPWKKWKPTVRLFVVFIPWSLQLKYT